MEVKYLWQLVTKLKALESPKMAVHCVARRGTRKQMIVRTIRISKGREEGVSDWFGLDVDKVLVQLKMNESF